MEPTSIPRNFGRGKRKPEREYDMQIAADIHRKPIRPDSVYKQIWEETSG
jgi:hypothetical protein